MPESSCLHIQDSASGPIRVVEIPWPVVRVGRASLCEVRLNDPDLAGEVCRLQRRGGTWQIEPLVSDAIVIDGRTVNGIRLLPFDTTIHIGPYLLTLHASRLDAPDWSLYQSHDANFSAPELGPKIASEPVRAATLIDVPSAAPIDIPSPRIARSPEPERPVSALREQQRWENRWRAAGEKLRAASPPKTPRSSLDSKPVATTPIDADRPTPHAVPQVFRVAPIPLKEAIPPRPPVSRSTSTERPAVEWGRHVRPEQVAGTARDSEAWRAGGGGPLSSDQAHAEDRGPTPPACRIEEDARPIVGLTLVSVDDADRGLTSNGTNFGRPGESRGGLSQFSTPSANDQVINPIVENETVPPRRDWTITGNNGSVYTNEGAIGLTLPACRSEEDARPIVSLTILSDDDADMEAMPPARRVEEGPHGANPPSPPEPSVDARISGWDPTWFDRQMPLDEDGDSPALPPAIDEESRFAAGTEWVAPAECLGTITTCFDGNMDLEPTAGFTASMHASGNRARPIRSIPRPSEPDPIEEVDRTSIPASPRSSPGSFLIADPEPDRPGRASWSSQAADLASAPLLRPADAGPRNLSGDWPSVDDILSTHRRAPNSWSDSEPRTGPIRTDRKPSRGPVLAAPSLAREPDCWELPLWLGWPPLAFACLLIGSLGCVMSWSWTMEARNASVVANRLLGKEAEVVNGRPVPLPDWIVPPSPTWYRSTARHLTNWAVYLGRSAEAGQRGAEIRDLLDGAVGASPAYAPARLALARIDDIGRDPADGPSTRGLALSRDSVSLAWAARRLLKAGRKDAAFSLFRRALVLATQPELAQDTFPKFVEDSQAQRSYYSLPGEELVKEIVAELASDRGLKFAEWSSVLPEGTVAPLVAARLLRDQSKRDSEASLDLILGRDDPSLSEGPAGAVRLAARAEAFVLRGKWKDAEREYQAAIERIDHDATSRSWWFNLADIESHLKNDAQRQSAIKMALASAPSSDDIARRAADLRRGQQSPTEPTAQRVRGVGFKAN